MIGGQAFLPVRQPGPYYVYLIFEPEHDKTNKMTCAPSEDSDQHKEALGP